MKNLFKPSQLDKIKAKTKPIRKKLKFLKRRTFWTKFVIAISAFALIATSILPYLFM